MGYDFTAIETKWQQYWLANRTFRALDPAEAGSMPKSYVLDMFPYPSGEGLHVGHPVGYTATDIISRFLRMRGHNVLHPMGWDAFGLPAEQYAIKNNTPPRAMNQKNIATFRRQLQMLGFSYDWEREVDTTDPAYYRWTQWIFLKLFNSYADPATGKTMPIDHLLNELFNERLVVAPDGRVVVTPTAEGMQEIAGEIRVERLWRELSPPEQREVIDGQRLAYIDELPVNWCPGLGTVLSNEEVVDGKSEIGGFPVERRPMRQWVLRITAYADRLLSDLDALDWPESLKEMQRNWIGKSIGAEVDFPVAPADSAGNPAASPRRGAEEEGDDLTITVFTTRPDTLFGATYMVLAPEHPLVAKITTPEQKSAVGAYVAAAAARSERDRLVGAKDKTGVFTGALAINPVNDERIPIYVADYVLISYGSGAIMAVPAHDERDFEFAVKFNIPIRPVVAPADDLLFKITDRAYTDAGIAVNSGPLNGLPTQQAKDRMIEILEEQAIGRRMVQYKLRDWLFSRQRYWGEPFPILFDEAGNPHAVDESQLPVMLPDLIDFKPTGTPEPPLSKAADWGNIVIDGKKYRRETNTMPQWAGSCWYYLRFIDPKNSQALIDPAKEKYWMPVDLYVGGVEHAVLHLLYARFWHKVLFDLGVVSTAEPFARLVNQGHILGEPEFHVFRDEGGTLVSVSDLTDVKEEATAAGTRLVGTVRATGAKAIGERIDESQVEKSTEGGGGGGGFVLKLGPKIRVDSRSFKMSKSRGNVVNPDKVVAEYGADSLRLYEMYMGPLEAQKPWSTRDMVGMFRFLSRVWRNFIQDEDAAGKPIAPVLKVIDGPIPESLDRQMNRAIKKVADDIAGLRFNTAIAELIELNNALVPLEKLPRALAENVVLMLSPFAPHVAEELWQRLGHETSLARIPWPTFDPAKLEDLTIELPVQVNGKLRARIVVPATADEYTILDAAEHAEKVQPFLAGKTVRKRVYVPKKLVNFVIG